MTVRFDLNQKLDSEGVAHVDENLRDFRLDLPAGLTGDGANVALCSNADFEEGICPVASQVGIATLKLLVFGSTFPLTTGVYNVAPSVGHPAELGFKALVIDVRPHIGVRPGDFGLTTTLDDVSTAGELAGSALTLWGVPADHSHDSQRFPSSSGLCVNPDPSVCLSPLSAGVPALPYVTNPTQCKGQPLVATLTVHSWQQPLGAAGDMATSMLPAIRGCEKLRFVPRVTVRPDALRSDSPSGYKVDVEVPQNEDPDGLATPQLKDAVVKLPAGVSLSPPAAEGLQACTDVQLGAASSEPEACPEASKIGTVTLTTPALPDQLQGGIYIGQPLAGDRYRIFLAMSGDGVSIKLRGSVKPDPQTGQLTTTFVDNPQQPFSRLELHFKGGDRAPLVNPAVCGPAVTTSELTPWSAPFTGGPATPRSEFDVSYDGSGGACPAAMPFAPTLTAGVTDPTAGASSPFVFHLVRPDRDQTLASIAGVQLPAGLLAHVSAVNLCTNMQAAADQCPASSQIGTALTGSGAGGSPLYLPGKVFLTGGYKGAPYGLAVVVPAVAGLYDLGDVTVRAAVNVDRKTAALSIDADPLPTILDGVPLQLRDIALNMDRPGFMLNPTNCGAMQVGATIGSAQGATATVSNRFQVRECERLAFKPKLTASTSAKASRRNGASLQVKIAYPQDREANIRSVKVRLPRQLAGRLSTLQHACPDKTFAENPGACPEGSRIGSATAITPLLASPLSGPAYFVSHGGAKFPELVVVLQGDGITVDLTGETFIAPDGITSSTFRNVPDVPIGSFTFDLPSGPHSVLGSKVASLCSHKLTMPTIMTAQNGAQLKQSTTIKVSGCARHKARRHHRRAHRRHRRK